MQANAMRSIAISRRARRGRPVANLYLLALGSNMRVPGMGAPRLVIAGALAALHREGLPVVAVSAVHITAPLGPARRSYANAAALVESGLHPPDVLTLLQRIERAFGRRRRGQRWRERPLDLDIVLWEGGVWRSAGLEVPHPEFRKRGFVLGPAAAIAPDWRDPVTNLTLRQLHARLTRLRPLPR